MTKSSLFTAFAVLIYIFMYVPIFVLIIYSFDDSRLAVEWTGFTSRWYQALAQDESIALALKNSLIVAGSAVAASTIMGTMAAVGLARARFAGKSVVSSMIILPIIVPEIAMAVSALILFIALGVSLGLASVIVAHIIFCLSYVALTVMARLEGMNEHLTEAALDLGATPWQAFYKVTLPLIAPGILSGALLAFVLSLDDFVITQFTAGVGATTLPLRIYSMVKFGVSPEINALSTLMLLVTICVTVAAEMIRQKGENRTVAE
ncbi:MAG: ABC transporter permease [Cyanobacteria bacterium SZAS LIN-2]|nr:ABC transporter permease [Cyanobacteria bacterium SZAS LIN-3]MBS1996090.1 ABC transporter permease [Cyanobacteria bacterium SZAS LIN-2]